MTPPSSNNPNSVYECNDMNAKIQNPPSGSVLKLKNLLTQPLSKSPENEIVLSYFAKKK